MDIILSSPGILFCLVVVSLEIFAAIFTSVFITIVILRDFLKKKKMKPGSKIRVALNMSSVLFTIVSSGSLYRYFTWIDPYKIPYLSEIFILLGIYSMCSSTWLTSLHCFFRFTKIVEFKSGFMAWVKMKIASIVDYSIGAIMMMSLGNSLLSILLFTSPQDLSTNSSLFSNNSGTFGTQTTEVMTVIFILTLNSMPLLTVIITTLMTVRFLWVHSHKMKKTMKISGEVNQKAYNRTMFKMMHFLVFYVVFYWVMLSFFLSVFPVQSSGYWVILILMFAFTPIHGVIVILETPKLKNTWKDMFCYISCSKN